MDIQKRLQGRRVAILCTNGVEQSELLEPREALLDQGAHVEIVSPAQDELQAWVHDTPGKTIPVDRPLLDASADDFDALVLPGGVMNPDELRINEHANDVIRGFVSAGKPIAAICHGPWTLIEAGGVRGKQMTSWPSLKTDLRNAGAFWADEIVIRDGNLVTSRKPDDLPEFNRELIEMISLGQTEERHQRPSAQPRDSAAPSAQI